MTSPQDRHIVDRSDGGGDMLGRMGGDSHREPQLPGGQSDQAGLEPALAGRIRMRAAEVLAPLCPQHAELLIRTDCRKKTPANWWAESRNGDLMSFLLPMGRLQSPARRTAALLAARFLRLSPHLYADPENRPRLAVETLERWARGEPGGTREAIRQAQAAVIALHQERRFAVNAALAGGVRGGAALHQPMERLASAAAHACSMPVVPKPADARAGLSSAATAVAGSEWRGGPGDAASQDARDRILAGCADLIRAAYPDIGAVLTELQAEMRR